MTEAQSRPCRLHSSGPTKKWGSRRRRKGKIGFPTAPSRTPGGQSRPQSPTQHPYRLFHKSSWGLGFKLGRNIHNVFWPRAGGGRAAFPPPPPLIIDSIITQLIIELHLYGAAQNRAGQRRVERSV